jgi:large conductance mechanosensitive channel
MFFALRFWLSGTVGTLEVHWKRPFIGGAFGAIFSSLVSDMIMPLIGIVLGGIDFTSLSLDVGEANLTYGSFIQAIINFVIIAFVIFLMIRQVKKMEKPAQAVPAAPPQPSAEEKLLTEIRDLLQEKVK